MNFPSGDIARIVIGGSIAGGESWSVGWYYLTSGAGSPTPADITNLAVDGLSLFNSKVWDPGTGVKLKAVNTSAFDLSFSKSYWYHNGVVQMSGAATMTPSVGTGTTERLPLYTCRVVTLRTNRAGRSFRGRTYLPWTGNAPAAATGLWTNSSDTPLHLADFLATFASTVNGYLGSTSSGPVVVSTTHGTAEPIVRLEMDNKPDTQRGREKKIRATAIDSHSVP